MYTSTTNAKTFSPQVFSKMSCPAPTHIGIIERLKIKVQEQMLTILPKTLYTVGGFLSNALCFFTVYEAFHIIYQQ